MGVEVV